MQKLILMSIVVLSFSSCNKEEELDITSLKLVEIINPPEAPEIYSNSSVEPELRIRNTGTIDITSVAIAYYIDHYNNGGGYSIGPTTTWFGTIKPNEEAIIILDKWESYIGPPLPNGTHMLFVDIRQINIESYRDDDNKLEKRLFILEE